MELGFFGAMQVCVNRNGTTKVKYVSRMDWARAAEEMAEADAEMARIHEQCCTAEHVVQKDRHFSKTKSGLCRI